MDFCPSHIKIRKYDAFAKFLSDDAKPAAAKCQRHFNFPSSFFMAYASELVLVLPRLVRLELHWLWHACGNASAKNSLTSSGVLLPDAHSWPL